MGGHQSKDYWKPDDSSDACKACREKFSVVRRIHHCRQCGDLFCDSCTTVKMPIPSRGYTEPVRVCRQCVVVLRPDRQTKPLDGTATTSHRPAPSSNDPEPKTTQPPPLVAEAIAPTAAPVAVQPPPVNVAARFNAVLQSVTFVDVAQLTAAEDPEAEPTFEICDNVPSLAGTQDPGLPLPLPAGDEAQVASWLTSAHASTPAWVLTLHTTKRCAVVASQEANALQSVAPPGIQW